MSIYTSRMTCIIGGHSQLWLNVSLLVAA